MKIFASVYLLVGALIIAAMNPAGIGIIAGALFGWVFWPVALLWRLHGGL